VQLCGFKLTGACCLFGQTYLASIAEWSKFLGDEREACLEDSHLIAQEIQSIQRKANFAAYVELVKTKDGKVDVDKNLDAMLVIHDRRPKEKKSPRGDSQSSALTKPSPAAKVTKDTKPAKKSDTEIKMQQQKAEQQTIVDIAELDIPESSEEEEGEPASPLGRKAAQTGTAAAAVTEEHDELAAIDALAAIDVAEEEEGLAALQALAV
jgi:hypothetical protein